jgi:hypothetical protein
MAIEAPYLSVIHIALREIVALHPVFVRCQIRELIEVRYARLQFFQLPIVCETFSWRETDRPVIVFSGNWIVERLPLGDPYFANPTKTNFEPRLGVAWDTFADGRLMVRSGFGIFDVLPLPYEFELLSMGVAPFFENATPNDLPPLSFPAGAVELAQNPTTLRYAYIEQQPRRNYVAQWNFNLEIQPTRTSSLLLGYVGSRGIHQPFRADDSNLVLPTKTTQGYAWPTPIGSGSRINKTAGRVDALFWRGDSYYSALQVQGRANVGSSVNLQVSYTWGKSIDTGSATIAGDQFSNSISSLP